MNAVQQCREQVAQPFSDWHFALRGIDDACCSALLGAIAFADRVKDIPHRASERAVAEKQLSWWRAQLAATSPSDFDALNTSRHPSLTALGELLRKDEIQSRLSRLLDLVEEDMDFAGFATREDMQRFFRTRGAVTLELFAAIANEKLNAETSAGLGYVYEYIELIAHFTRHAQAGVVYLAQDDLQKHQQSAEQLLLRDADKLPSWPALFDEQTTMAEMLFAQHINTLPRTILAVKRYLRLRMQWLKTTQRHGYPMYRYHLELSNLHKYFICLKTNWF